MRITGFITFAFCVLILLVFLSTFNVNMNSEVFFQIEETHP